MGDNKTYTIGNLTFWHVTFQDIDPGIKDDLGAEEKSFKEALNRIPTSFSIDAKDTKRIDRAVDLLRSVLIELLIYWLMKIMLYLRKSGTASSGNKGDIDNGSDLPYYSHSYAIMRENKSGF